MNTNKAAYWIALGVLALGLNSEYRHGNFVALHRVAERADSALCQIAMRAEQTLAVAGILTNREGFAADSLLASASESDTARAQAEMAHAEAELFRDRVRDQVRDQVRAQADVIRARAEMQRAEIEQIRFRIPSQVRLARTVGRRVMVVCPKTGIRIAVNAGSDLAEISPDVEVEDSF
jgi:hypothetical protein